MRWASSCVGRPRLRAAICRDAFGAFIQYPGASGRVWDPTSVIEAVHAKDGQVVVAADLLAMTLLKPPGELGADVAVGTSQRFGVPMGFGGPHAGYLAVRAGLERQLPGPSGRRLAGRGREPRLPALAASA